MKGRMTIQCGPEKTENEMILESKKRVETEFPGARNIRCSVGYGNPMETEIVVEWESGEDEGCV